jgi:hypothetical protein
VTDTTVAPGAAADLLSGPAMPADQARTKIAELTANPDWVKRHLGGDHETKAELQRLHEIAFQPAPGSIITGTPPIEAQLNEQAAHLGTMSDVSDDVLDHVRTGASVSASEYRLAVAKKDALFSDPQWRDSYFAGGYEARQQKLLLDVILASKVRPGA